MGKVRVTSFGDESSQEAEKQKKAVKKAEKLNREKSAQGETAEAETDTNDAPAVSEEGTTQTVKSTETPEIKADEPQAPAPKKTKKEKFAKKSRGRSAAYSSKAMQIDTNKIYSLSEGIELLKKIKTEKFNETVELHINTTETGISGQVKLPHGNGKEIKIAIATDEVLAEVEKGKINFDILIAEPSQMSKLARVARVLGPRGLMPNPKNGTISDNPEEAMKKFQGGQINFKTESKSPLMHLSIGKTSFENKQLEENIITLVKAIKREKIKKVTLKSTMSPAIRIQV